MVVAIVLALILVIVNIRLLQTMVSGIPRLLALGTRISDPYVSVALWAPIVMVWGERSFAWHLDSG